jgi:hypothetical protein
MHTEKRIVRKAISRTDIKQSFQFFTCRTFLDNLMTLITIMVMTMRKNRLIRTYDNHINYCHNIKLMC